MELTVLCKVVDNYGDIGFVYRLCRALSELDRSLQLRLVVSDLAAFQSMNRQIDAHCAVQEVDAPAAAENSNRTTGTGVTSRASAAHTENALHAPSARWQVFDWNAADVCTRAFSENPPSIILECFQCGRPDWLDALLFGDRARDIPALANEHHIVHILNIDYLTAEPYADDFHCLKSGTRSLFVKKVNFMPGFTPKTAGLTLDSAFCASRARRTLPKAVQALVNAAYTADRTLHTADSASAASPTTQCANHASATDNVPQRPFYVPIFSYERDFTPIVQALTRFQATRRATDKRFSVCVLVAAGKSAQPFFDAWNAAGKPFTAVALPFLAQEDWDAVLCAGDCNLVRGEDSLSRACLAGAPFLWHAYPQEDEYQLVKVQALLDRLRAYLSPDAYALVCDAWLSYNRMATAGAEAFSTDRFYSLLTRSDELTAAFSAFSSALIANGNFAAHLLSYLDCKKYAASVQ